MHPTSKLLLVAVVLNVQLAFSANVTLCEDSAPNTTVVCVQSNHTYTLNRCIVPTVGTTPVFLLFVFPSRNSSSCNATSDPTDASNIAIIVTEGNVWPRFETTSKDGNTNLTVRNITIVVQGARIGINKTDAGGNDTLPTYFSLLSITPLSSLSVSNITIYVQYTTALFRLRAYSQNTSAVPLLHIQGARSAATAIGDITVTVLSSNLSCSLIGNGETTKAGFVVIRVLGSTSTVNTSVSNIRFDVQMSYVALRVNSSAVIHSYDGVDPTIFTVSADTNKFVLFCHLQNVSFTSNSSALSAINYFPVFDASDVTSLVMVSGFSNISDVRVNFADGTAMAQCSCRSNFSTKVSDINPRSRIFELNAIEDISYLENCDLVATNMTMTSESPVSALTFSIKDASLAVNLRIYIRDSSLNIGGTALIPTDTRSMSLITVNVLLFSRVQLIVISLVGNFTADSGGAESAVSSTLVDFPSFGTNLSITVSDVNVTATFTGGWPIVVSKSVAKLVIASTLISVVPLGEQVLQRQELNITVRSSVLTVQHAVRLPVELPIFSFVVSIAAILNSIQSLQNSFILMERVRLVRVFVEQKTPPWFPGPFGVRFNITAHINLMDQSAILDSIPGLSVVGSIVDALTNGSFHVTHFQTHTNMTQCSLHVSPSDIALSETDVFMFMTLPSNFTNCTAQMTDLNAAATFPVVVDERSIGAPFGSLGAATITDTQLTVRRANLTMLLFGVFANVVFTGKSMSYTIERVVVESFPSPLQTMSMFVFGLAMPGVTFTVTLPLASQLSFLNITDSTFASFTDLFMPSTVKPLGSPKHSMRLLELGCNLWNGSPMSIDVIGLTTLERSYINYSPSYFPSDPSKFCIGYRSPTLSSVVTPSMTLSHLKLSTEDVPSTAVTSSLTAVATSIAGIAGALSGGASLMDAQTLVGLGQSSCAPQQLKDSTSTSQFLLSPFYPLGDVGIVLGNVGFFCVLHGFHRLLLMVSRRRSSKAAQYRSNALFPQLRVGGNVDFHRGDGGVSAENQALTVVAPEVASKFPNHSILAAILLMPGVIHGGTRGLFSGDVIGSVVGVVAVIAVSLCVWWRVRTGRSQLVLRMKFMAYKMKVIKDFIAPWALPLGYWGPERSRAMFGRLRGPVRGGAEWLAAHSQSSTLIVQFVSSIPIPQSWCTGLWFVLVGVYVVSCVVVVYFRPSRAPLSDVLAVVAHTASGTVVLLAGVKSIVGQDSSDSDALVTALLVASFVSMAISLLKTVHSVVMFVWEQRQQQQQLALAPERDAVSSEYRASVNPTRGLRLLSRQGASIGHIRSLPVVVEDMLFEERPQKEKLRLLVEMVCTREI